MLWIFQSYVMGKAIVKQYSVTCCRYWHLNLTIAGQEKTNVPVGRLHTGADDRQSRVGNSIAVASSNGTVLCFASLRVTVEWQDVFSVLNTWRRKWTKRHVILSEWFVFLKHVLFRISPWRRGMLQDANQECSVRLKKCQKQ